jgi:thiosulfate dehydrogenase (quinone) large subunit
MKTGAYIHNTNPKAKAIALLRVAFGVIWAIDAQFKWRPAFANNFTRYIQGAIGGQPAFIQTWLNFWVKLVSVNPLLFARLVALAETAIAIGLILGIFSNLTNIGGALLAFVIWAVPEGLGGPYIAGATDVGTGIIYVFVFAALFLLSAGKYYGFDRILQEKLERLRFLSSAPDK